MLLSFCRPSGGRILEALHVDPASSLSLEHDKGTKVSKPPIRYFVNYHNGARFSWWLDMEISHAILKVWLT